MKSWKVLLCLAGIVAFAVPALAQIPTGTVAGRVTDGTAPLPGVTVTVTSPNLQGARTAVTGGSGDYIFRFLPPGEYRVRFELSGFQTVEASIKVSAAQNTQLDAEMPQARLQEEITVTGSYETIATAGTASTTFEASLVEKLPLGRDLNSFVAMAPGVTTQGPNAGITISGGFSYENLFMVNGVVLNENIRGQALPLFIEDAIEETTTSTSGISAEYGRFGGGVVNAVTKSGGNQFSGSLRTNFENPKWTAATPLTVSRADTLSKIYEATLGGFALKDRLWFFLAGRTADQSQSLQTYLTNIPYTMNTEETRYEAKLTFSLNPSHRVVGSYFERERAWENYGFVIDFYDLDSIYDRSIPEDLLAANYTGVITDNFFVEAQYSTRHLTFKDSGSRFTDLEKGTVFWDYYTTGATYNSPIFCAVCPGSEEKRDNENILLKGSLFFSGAGGSHDINIGLDTFNDKRLTNNWQSGSGYFLIPTETIIQGGNFYPVFDDWSEIWYFPIFEFSKGTNFKTNSLFLNDRWRFNNNWSFNIGVRYDKNDGKDAMGQKTVDDAKVSPRLGVTWDPKGDGEWTVNASYATYVAAIANSIADSSSIGGTPAEFDYWYGGPPINVNGPQYTARQVATMVFNWFFNVYGGPNNLDNLVWLDIPGVATQIPQSLKSPSTDEISLGFAKRFGTKGLVRMDYVRREWKDFYSARVDMSTGQVTNDFGQTFDLKVIENTSEALEKTYDGLMLQFQYRLLDNVQIGGNYTLSKAYGNVIGETAGSGPVTVAPFSYPEYTRSEWNLPKGRLSIDQKHRARLFLSWDALNTRYHRVNLSVLQNFFSGTPYGASGAVPVRAYVTNPGYVTPPANVTYYYTARDAYRTDNITRSDLAANYSFVLPAFGSNLEFFVQPEVFNVFNEKGVTSVNTTVTRLAAFNPFTTAPIECPQGTPSAQCPTGSNWKKGDNFGKPTAPGNYQQPRTFRISVGVRF